MFAFTRLIRFNFDTSDGIRNPGARQIWLLILVGMINGTTVSLLDFIFKYIIKFLVNKENHKYEAAYERSLITKRFIFVLIISNLGLCWTAFVELDFFALR